jgi:Tfp pilus assembly protein PilF
LLASVVLVLLGVGLATTGLRVNSSDTVGENSEPLAANGQQAERASSNTVDASPEADPARPGLSALRQKVLSALVTVYRGSGRGSGFVIEEGLVVTSYHVVPQGQAATVVFQDRELALVVEHVISDASRDIAVLRTNTKKERQPLKLAAFLPATGAQVAAFKPGGGELQGTVTGIGISKIPGEAAGCDMLQTTLNTVPGWSGGPVLNMEGEVVGVNKRLDGSNFESQGLKIATGSAAIPVTVLKPLLAIVRLTRALQSDPNNAAHRRDRAVLYMSIREFNKAIDDYTELIWLEPNNATLYYCRGKAYAEMGDIERATADYMNWIALNEDFDKTIADLSAVLRLQPDDLEAHEERARLYDAKGESDLAVADYTEAIRLAPKRADLYRRRGVVLAVKGAHDSALDDFTEAIRLDPKDAEAYCARGAVHGGRHDFNKAIADFTEAIRLDRWPAKAYFDRGSAYRAQGDEAKAQADFERAKGLGYRLE